MKWQWRTDLGWWVWIEVARGWQCRRPWICRGNCTHILFGVKGLIPLVKVVEKNSLGWVGRAESRLKRIEQVVGVKILWKLDMNLLLENFAGNGEKRDVTVECRNFILTSAWRHPPQMLTHHSGLPSAVPPLNLINIVISFFTISQLNSSLSSAISLSILSFSLTSMSFVIMDDTLLQAALPSSP